jgi:hypothetical protein
MAYKKQVLTANKTRWLKKIWYLERTFPSFCPRCKNTFSDPNKNYGIVMDRPAWAEISKFYSSITKSLYPVRFVTCLKCGNITLLVVLSSGQVNSREKAFFLKHFKGFNSCSRGMFLGDPRSPQAQDWILNPGINFSKKGVRK